MEKELFSKFRNMGKAPETVDVNAVSRISEGTSVAGELSSTSDIRIDGTVKGKIFSEGRIVVGEHAFIDGEIFCNNLDLWGRVHGEIYVKDVLSLKSSASVEGELHVRRIQVEMGAAINGTCKMITDEDFSKPSEVEEPA